MILFDAIRRHSTLSSANQLFHWLYWYNAIEAIESHQWVSVCLTFDSLSTRVSINWKLIKTVINRLANRLCKWPTFERPVFRLLSLVTRFSRLYPPSDALMVLMARVFSQESSPYARSVLQDMHSICSLARDHVSYELLSAVNAEQTESPFNSASEQIEQKIWETIFDNNQHHYN